MPTPRVLCDCTFDTIARRTTFTADVGAALVGKPLAKAIEQGNLTGPLGEIMFFADIALQNNADAVSIYATIAGKLSAPFIRGRVSKHQCPHALGETTGLYDCRSDPAAAYVETTA